MVYKFLWFLWCKLDPRNLNLLAADPQNLILLVTYCSLLFAPSIILKVYWLMGVPIIKPWGAR